MVTRLKLVDMAEFLRKTMVNYNGIKIRGNQNFILFTHKGKTAEVPVDKVTADRISKYISLICPPMSLYMYNDDSVGEHDIKCSVCGRVITLNESSYVEQKPDESTAGDKTYKICHIHQHCAENKSTAGK